MPKPKHLIGCSGWNYMPWLGAFYPKNLARDKWLGYYAKKFNSVEINYTFYRLPKESTVEKWRASTPKNFKITLKGSRYITHIKRFKGTSKAVREFCKRFALLEEKQGCILWQLPPNSHKDMRSLEAIVKQLNTSYDNAIEFRHKSWFVADVCEYLNKNNISFCSVSAPRLPEEMYCTKPAAYVRMHGTSAWYRHDYLKSELKEWAARIKKCKAKRIYVYFNNDFNANAPKNALTLAGALKQHSGIFCTRSQSSVNPHTAYGA